MTRWHFFEPCILKAGEVTCTSTWQNDIMLEYLRPTQGIITLDLTMYVHTYTHTWISGLLTNL